MFTRRADNITAPITPGVTPIRPPRLPAQTSRTSDISSVIGPDLSITGNLESPGEVRIEGEVQGDVHAGRIVIGERAHVTGALIADEIIIGGSVQGSIRGNRVTFQSASRVEGDVIHRSLAIEQGAFFEGKSRRSDDPTSVQPSPSAMPPPG